MEKLSRSAIISVPVQKFFDVITDYESYPRFLDDMKSVKIISQKKNESVVQFELNIIKKITYTLKLTEKSPTSLTWQLVEGDWFTKNSGSWKLSEKDGETKATYTLDIGLSKLIPKMITQMIVSSNLPKTLDSFKSYAESKKSSGPKKKAKA